MTADAGKRPPPYCETLAEDGTGDVNGICRAGSTSVLNTDAEDQNREQEDRIQRDAVKFDVQAQSPESSSEAAEIGIDEKGRILTGLTSSQMDRLGEG